MRFLFYSHDSVGLGSARRQLAVASALNRIAPDAKMLLTTSVDEAVQFDLPPMLNTFKLPGIQKQPNGEYSNSRLGISGAGLRAMRSALLHETLKRFQPTVIIVDKHPFGVGGELDSVLATAKASGVRLVFGLRDILDDASAVRREWDLSRTQQRMAALYDLVLIYGKSSVYDPVDQYQFPAVLAQHAEYCGYVVNQQGGKLQPDDISATVLPNRDGRPAVLCAVGGGEDGAELLRIFIQAAAGANWQGFVVAGPLLPDREKGVLAKLAAKNGVSWQIFNPHLARLFATANALVCMGGYNTLSEALSVGIPTVCIPRTKPRSEQLLRATAFERLGLLQTIPSAELNAVSLAHKVSAAIKDSREDIFHRANTLLTFDGARQAASHILKLAADRT